MDGEYKLKDKHRNYIKGITFLLLLCICCLYPTVVHAAYNGSKREKKFDFSRPIGSSSAILTIRSDNSKVIMHDFDSYNGMSIALLKGNTRDDDLKAFAKENHFTYSPIYWQRIMI